MADAKDNPWEDLILAILSVNNYSLEKTYSAVQTLHREGLFSPENLVRWTFKEIETRLRRGGYNRGDYMTALFAKRIASLGKFVGSVGVKECERILRKSDAAEVRQFLSPVTGIGPRVLENYFLLRKGQ